MSASAYRCGVCKRLLDEPRDLAVEKRSPCGECGSLTRLVEVTGTVALATAVAVTPQVVVSSFLVFALGHSVETQPVEAMLQSIDREEPIADGASVAIVVVVLALGLGKLLVRLVSDKSG